jgi:uncharacterized protein (TIGR03437 family)
MKTNGTLLIFGLSLLAVSFPALAQPVTCTAATLTGAHSIILNGRDVLSTAVLSNVNLSVGTATFDGVSGVTFKLTSNTNLLQGATPTWSGTYSLASNCVGTLNISAGDTAAFTLIPYNQGRDFTITGQDGTYALTGTGGFPPAACVTATLSGAYTFSGNGYGLSSGIITGVNSISGLLQFDGAGAVNGSWSVGSNGAAAASTVTGHYTVSSSCVASGTVTDANGLTYSLAFTVTSADAANFGVLISSPVSTFTATGHSTFTYPGLAVELAAGAGLTTPAGSLFSVYGFGLSAGKGQFTMFPLPPSLASATIMVNGEIAPIFALDNTALGKEGLINAQMPLDIQPGVATLVVKNGNAVSNAVAITIPSTAFPAVIVNGNNHAAARNTDAAATANSPSAPISTGDVLAVYFLGGPLVQGQNLLTTGGMTPYPPLFPVASNIARSATVAGLDATINYIGLVPLSVGGFYQANIVITKVAAGERNLVLTIGGQRSNLTTISVKERQIQFIS